MLKAPRARRSPDEARRLILAATLRLLARSGPDAIGLKDVAREAGVSHALVTHYFGTFDALIEAAFAAHVASTRAEIFERITELAGGGPAAWIELAAEQLGDPVYGRLAAWALLSGRVDQFDFFPRRDQGFRKVADAIEMRLAFDGARTERDDLEFRMMLVLSSLMGYTVARRALWAGFGKDCTPERDAWFRDRLSTLVAGQASPAKRPARTPRKSAKKTAPPPRRAPSKSARKP